MRAKVGPDSVLTWLALCLAGESADSDSSASDSAMATAVASVSTDSTGLMDSMVAGSDVVRATRGAVSSTAVAGESVFTDAEVGESAMAMVDVSSSGRRMEHTGSSSH